MPIDQIMCLGYKKHNASEYMYVHCFAVCIFFEGSVFTFQFLNDRIHNYVKKAYYCEFYHSKN